jgi:hypothetical protein
VVELLGKRERGREGEGEREREKVEGGQGGETGNAWETSRDVACLLVVVINGPSLKVHRRIDEENEREMDDRETSSKPCYLCRSLPYPSSQTAPTMARGI